MPVVRNLSKRLPDGRPLLKDISFCVDRGEFVAMVFGFSREEI